MTDFTKQNTYDDAESRAVMFECSENGRNLGSVILGRAAMRHGAELEWLNYRDLWAVLPDRRVAISGHFGTESALAAGIVSGKHFTKQLLQAAGISVPHGRLVASAEDAITAQREIGGPVVIKPANGAMGHGVTVNVIDEEDVREGYLRAARDSSGVLVEQYIGNSSEYRAHATETECVGVFQRLLPNVVGDGKSTVAELINDKNEWRQRNPSTRGNPIPLDDVADGFLRRQNLNRSAIPEAGQNVVVRDVNGITSGGDSQECLDTASDELKNVATGAVAAIPGMDWGGVDILVDHDSGKPYVIEVNTSAAISGSTYPVFGTPRDLPSILWNRLYDRSSPTPISASAVEWPKVNQPAQTLKMKSSGNEDSVTLRTLLQAHLKANGYRLHRRKSRIWNAAKTDADAAPLWFNTVLTGSDMQMAINPLRKRVLYRQVLQARGIPRPVGKWVSSRKQLEEYRNSKQADLELIPDRTGLGSNGLVRVPRNQPLDEISIDWNTKWFAQVRRRGKRFQVIATPTKPLAVLSDKGSRDVSQDVLELVSSTACRAVTAIPELRWAVADVLYRPSASTDSTSPETFVEYMSVNPDVPRDAKVLLGSMDEVFAVIIEGAQGTLAQHP